MVLILLRDAKHGFWFVVAVVAVCPRRSLQTFGNMDDKWRNYIHVTNDWDMFSLVWLH